MAKNEYARKLRERKEAERALAAEIVKAWTAQLCLDVMTIVLNDPEVMGKDVFGTQRLKKVEQAFNEEFPKWVVGLTEDVKASYTREKMDERLVKIWGDEFQRWPQRYELWNDRGI